MATQTQIAVRRAILHTRLWEVVNEMVTMTGVEAAPPFPNTRDKDYRANNETERAIITLERIRDVMRAAEGEPDNGGNEIPDGQ
jgi:hypothetical protein